MRIYISTPVNSECFEHDELLVVPMIGDKYEYRGNSYTVKERIFSRDINGNFYISINAE